MLVQILDRSRTLDADVLQVQTTSSRFNHAHVCQSVMCTFQIYIYCQHCRNKVEDRADFMVFAQGPSNLDFKPTSIQVRFHIVHFVEIFLCPPMNPTNLGFMGTSQIQILDSNLGKSIGLQVQPFALFLPYFRAQRPNVKRRKQKTCHLSAKENSDARLPIPNE